MANGIDFPSWTTNSDTQITATTPPLTPGRHTVYVETNVGRSIGGVASQIVAMNQPQITSISPATGADSGGTAVTITGVDFLDPDNGQSAVVAVEFDGNTATSITVVSNTQIQCVTPAGTAGDVDFTVQTYVGTVTESAGFTYTATASAPTITSVSPSSGSTAGGYQVRFFGTDFVGISAVNVDGVPVAHVVDNPTRITIPSMPAHAAGAINIQAVNTHGNDTISFTYAAQTAPAQPLTFGGTLFARGGAVESQITFGVYAADFTIQDDREVIDAADITTALQVELINAFSSDHPLLEKGFINTVVPSLLLEPGKVTRKNSKTIHVETVTLGYDLANGSREQVSLLVPDTWLEPANLISNPGFEAGTTGWAQFNSATITRVTTEANEGVASLEIQSPGSVGDEGAVFAGVPVDSSTLTRVTGWFKGASGNVHININEIDGGSGYIRTETGASTALTGDWQRLAVEFTTNASTATLDVHLLTFGAQAITFYVDTVKAVHPNA